MSGKRAASRISGKRPPVPKNGNHQQEPDQFPLILNLLKDGNAASNRIQFPPILNLLRDGNAAIIE